MCENFLSTVRPFYVMFPSEWANSGNVMEELEQM